MDLYLHKVIHPQAPENYRVILKDDDCQEIEIGSIGIQHAARAYTFWQWRSTPWCRCAGWRRGASAGIATTA